MKTVRPENNAPIPLRSSPHRMGTIVLRFVVILAVTVTLLTLAWNH